LKRIPVTSSSLASAGYDPASMTLEVEFAGGTVYQYFEVPENTYNELMSAGSQGQFFHTQIKGSFRFAKV
jgi:KTSC domain